MSVTPAGTVSLEVVPRSEDVVRMTAVPEVEIPPATQVGELPVVQATGVRLAMAEKLVDDHREPLPPQEALAPLLPLPVATQVRFPVPGQATPPSTAAEEP